MSLARLITTERFVQHPRKPCDDGDYGLLKLKEGEMPAIAPKFKDHRVNGLPTENI
jgi:hypothetical protein